MRQEPPPWQVLDTLEADIVRGDSDGGGATASVGTWLNVEPAAAVAAGSAEGSASGPHVADLHVGGGRGAALSGIDATAEVEPDDTSPAPLPPEPASGWLDPREGIVKIAGFVTGLGGRSPNDSVNTPPKDSAASKGRKLASPAEHIQAASVLLKTGCRKQKAAERTEIIFQVKPGNVLLNAEDLVPMQKSAVCISTQAAPIPSPDKETSTLPNTTSGQLLTRESWPEAPSATVALAQAATVLEQVSLQASQDGTQRTIKKKLPPPMSSVTRAAPAPAPDANGDGDHVPHRNGDHAPASSRTREEMDNRNELLSRILCDPSTPLQLRMLLETKDAEARSGSGSGSGADAEAEAGGEEEGEHRKRSLRRRPSREEQLFPTAPLRVSPSPPLATPPEHLDTSLASPPNRARAAPMQVPSMSMFSRLSSAEDGSTSPSRPESPPPRVPQSMFSRRGSIVGASGRARRGSVSFYEELPDVKGEDGQVINTLEQAEREHGVDRRLSCASEGDLGSLLRVSSGNSTREEDDFGEFGSWQSDMGKDALLASNNENENEWDEPEISLERIEADVTMFCLETGGGFGTWLRNGEGQSFGLGVTKMEGGANRADSDSDSETKAGQPAESMVSGGVRITMPNKFAEGRDIRELKQQEQKKKPQTWQQLLRVPYPRAVAFGRISWDSMEEPANFIRCTNRTSEAVLPHLLRFFAERVWGLKRPGMIISVVGSSGDLDLRAEQHRKLRGVMTAANETGAWVTTSGFDGGVSKLMGGLRKETDNQVPLLGFVPWGMVEGRQALWEPEADGRVAPHVEKLPVEEFQMHEKHFHAVCGSRLKAMRVDRGHSHLFFVDDGTVGQFGNEARIRAAFETAVDVGEGSMQSRIRDALLENGLGWQLAHMRQPVDAKLQGAKRGGGPTPSVGICVGGSNTSIKRVREMVERGTPCLLAKGTRGAADLLSDLVFMVRNSAEEHELQAAEPDVFTRTSSGVDSLLIADMDHENEKYHLPEEKFQLMVKLLAREDNSNDIQLEDEVNTLYELRHPIKDVGGLISTAKALAMSHMLQIFDVDRNEDLPGAMLSVVLHKQRDQGVEWKDCLRLIVSWNDVNIMKRTLEKVGKVTVHTRRAIEAAFHLAFKRNKASMAYCLLEHLDCTNSYNIRGDMSSLWGAALLTVKKKRVSQTKPVIRWGDLVGKALKELNEELGGGLALERWSELCDLGLHDEEVRKLFVKSRHKHHKHMKSATPAKSFAVGSLGTNTNRNSTLDTVRTKSIHSRGRRGSVLFRSVAGTYPVSREMECKQQLAALEAVYRALLGTEFWHETSSGRPVLDLFFWSLLMRRKAMVKMLWVRMDVPVRTMLTAAALYRGWVTQATDLKAHTKEALLADAVEFEQVAVSVQTYLMRMDSMIALECVEMRSLQWKGLSAVDVAVRSGSETFVEHCCGEALDLRWTGDIHPYDQPFGLYITVLLCVLSFGLLAPSLVVFRPPPRAEALRAPAQSRAIPTGHHERQRKVEPYTDADTAISQRNLWLTLQGKNQAGSSSVYLPDDDGDAGEDIEMMGRIEKVRLFASAPVTIFMVDALQQFFYNALFTALLINHDAHSLPAHSLTWTEILICWSTASTNVYEILELLLEGWHAYFSNSWNSIQLASCTAFWLGLAKKLSGTDSEGLKQTRIYYATSLFFMWTRVLYVLSVHKEVGPLVIAFSRMRRDVLLFASIWAVLLLAFSTAMQAAEPSRFKAHIVATGKQGPENPMFGWDSWWLVRTYYQSFGEPFYEELTTDASNVVMLIMFPVMNLMLVNLLIAIMNDTYTDVKHRSKLQWMLQMYQVGKEYRSSARLNLLMLFWDIFEFWRRKSEVDSRTNHLRQGFSGWLDDLRFKYKRFQTRDLPPVDKKDVQIELARRIDELEAKELGSASKNVGIPGRVWMKRQVEWHKDVTALGTHQYLRKELAIRCSMRGCVAVPFQLSVDGEKPMDKDGQERGLVLIFYSAERMKANIVDQIIRAVHSHQAEEEAAAEAAGAPAGAADAEVVTDRSPSDPSPTTSTKEPMPEMVQRLTSFSGLGSQHRLAPASSGGEEPAASVLKRTCEECHLDYAEAMRPCKGKMEICAHFYRGHNAEVFYKETTEQFVFPQDVQGQGEAERSIEADELDAIKQGLRNTGWSGDFRISRSSFGGRNKSNTLSEHSSMMSGNVSNTKSMDKASEVDAGSMTWKSSSVLRGLSLGRNAGRSMSVSEVKGKLKDALLKLRVQAKQDQESIRSAQALLITAQAEYAQANSIGAYLKVD